MRQVCILISHCFEKFLLLIFINDLDDAPNDPVIKSAVLEATSSTEMTATVTLQNGVSPIPDLNTHVFSDTPVPNEVIHAPGTLVYKWTGLQPGMIYNVEISQQGKMYGVSAFTVTPPAGKCQPHLCVLK